MCRQASRKLVIKCNFSINSISRVMYRLSNKYPTSESATCAVNTLPVTDEKVLPFPSTMPNSTSACHVFDDVTHAGIFLVLFGSSLYTYVKITEVQKGHPTTKDKHESGKPLLPK